MLVQKEIVRLHTGSWITILGFEVPMRYIRDFFDGLLIARDIDATDTRTVYQGDR